MRTRRDRETCQAAVNLTLTQPVSVLRRVQDLESYRRRLGGLSQAELGDLLGAYRNHGRTGEAYTRQAVSAWERGAHPLTADVRAALAQLIDTAVQAATHGRVSVRAQVSGRTWKFEAVGACALCGKPFVLKRSNQKHCARCI